MANSMMSRGPYGVTVVAIVIACHSARSNLLAPYE